MAKDAAPGDGERVAVAPAPTTAERLEAFASAVNHDLRNPLNVAQGRLELARSETDNEHLEIVARSHERLATLIESSVTWARAGLPPEDVVPTELEQVAGWARESVPAGSVDLEVAADRAVEADPNKLQQAFEQLLTNAVEHGDPPVRIRVETYPDGFRVEDSGPGIPPDKRDRVFEPGYSTDPEAPGFGLSIVAAVASAHGWRLTVGEGRDGGARFTFETAPDA